MNVSDTTLDGNQFTSAQHRKNRLLVTDAAAEDDALAPYRALGIEVLEA